MVSGFTFVMRTHYRISNFLRNMIRGLSIYFYATKQGSLATETTLTKSFKFW